MIASWRLAAIFVGLGWVHSANASCTVACTCVVSTTSVAFGVQNVLAASNIDGTGNVSVQCTGTAGSQISYTVAMSAGSSNLVSARSMSSGTSKLFYNLYTTSSYATVLGDGTGGSNSVLSSSITLDGLGSKSQDSTIYGRIVAGQRGAVPGLYTDNLVVTVTYQ